MAFIEINGELINYRENREGIGGESPTLLFLHGAGGNSKHWAAQLRFPFGPGYDVIALDLPGHGRSEGELIGSISEYAEFVLAFLQKMGLKKVVMAGHSMGGGITLEFALRYPQFLQGIILISTGAKLKVSPNVLHQLAQGEHPLDLVKHFYSSQAGEAVLQQAVQDMKRVHPQVYLSDFLACDSFERIEDVKRIDVPTFIICGEDDQMTPLKYSVYLHKAIPDAKLVALPGAGHLLMFERAQAFNEALQHFLKDLPQIKAAML